MRISPPSSTSSDFSVGRKFSGLHIDVQRGSLRGLAITRSRPAEIVLAKVAVLATPCDEPSEQGCYDDHLTTANQFTLGRRPNGEKA